VAILSVGAVSIKGWPFGGSLKIGRLLSEPLEIPLGTAMTALFITFEGLDGSGKSTHLNRARAWIQGLGRGCVVTHEPGGTPLGQEIRDIFKDARWGRLDGVVELLLIVAARRENVREVIRPALDQGSVVLCDRFSDSTWAYQGWGRGVSPEVVDAVDRLATDGLRPNLTLLFDLDPEVARSRGRGRVLEEDRLDAETLAFFRRVRQGYLKRAQDDPGRFVIIDSSGTKEDTESRVIEALSQALGSAT
jgi:dTMP kinase